ncbi:MAG TPA: PD-(D/E)XK nuclease family protein [Gaiellaceae bacterium]|jgi:ATP-dependent helicase/DNAse subunit B|nr:PD-(D/E)XK nuclease family protein [Gaiellaceae bacterium]
MAFAATTSITTGSDGPRGLSLISGPANAGKVALLLERYLARLDDEPFLIVPNGSDVARVESELLDLRGCLLGGTIGTFDDLFARLAPTGPGRRPVASQAQRALIARRAVAAALRDGAPLSPSARFAGFADSLLTALTDLEGGLLDPQDLDGELAALYAAYRAELDRLGLWDRDLLRRSACERLRTDFGAWSGEPVFAYGFEDLTAAEWSLLEALAGRCELQVSLPYEPGRPAFASLARTAADLAGLADGRIEELPARSAEFVAPGLAHLERSLFETEPAQQPIGGAVRFLAGAGVRGTLELVADQTLAALREGVPPERIGIVVPSVERWRAPLETVMGALGIPHAIEARANFTDTPLGHALVSLLRFAWAGGGRRELYAFLRTPYSGISRQGVDFVEGRLRGRAIATPARVEEETERLREAPLVALRELRNAPTPLEGIRALLDSMVRTAYGLEAPPAGDAARLDLGAFGAAADLLDELAALESLGEPVGTTDAIESLARLQLRPPRAGEAGRVVVLDLARARTRRFDTVFILGLEEGALPRRGRNSPFLDDDRRRELGARLERPDPVSRDRYLFYTACTRATRRLYLVRQAATDDGSPLEESPFWHDAAAPFLPEEVERATIRRALSELTWPIEAAPTERERLRALARLTADANDVELALALADTNGWTRRLQRARRAFTRETRLRNPAVLAQFGGRTVFGATELERFVDCSSAWLMERVVDPKTIDAEADALLRGKVAHQTLYAFYSGLPKELGADRVTPDSVDAALRFLNRCLDDAFASGVRIELGEVESAELRESLRRDLERFVRTEAESKLAFLPRRFELGFGTDRSAPELQRGLELGDGLFMSGKIDRIDIDPGSARGIVQDYKSGKGSFSARQIDVERRLQVPLYMLVLRDLAGIEPLGGVYRALSGARAARGMLRAGEREDLPGFNTNDYLDEEAFWGQVEAARDHGLAAAKRIRAGDVSHDPKGGECPSWCDLWTMCRIAKA